MEGLAGSAAAHTAPAGVAGPASITWQPENFDFDPYSLQVAYTGGSALLGAAAAAAVEQSGGSGRGADARRQHYSSRVAAAQQPGGSGVGPAAGQIREKGKPGRKKRTSVLCQVPDCGEELVGGKPYYRRYRICRHHSVIQSITIHGVAQRFCQQCGRFHEVTAFEADKKSCKIKLIRHNQRRTGTFKKKRGRTPRDKFDGDTTEEDEGALGIDLTDDEGEPEQRVVRRSSTTARRQAKQSGPSAAAAKAVASVLATDGASDDDATHSSSAQRQGSGLARSTAGGAPTISPPVSGLKTLRLGLGLSMGIGGSDQRQISSPSRAANAVPFGGSIVSLGTTGTDSTAQIGGDDDPLLDSILMELLDDEDLQCSLQPALLAGLGPARAPAAGAFSPPPRMPSPPPLHGDDLLDDVLLEALLEDMPESIPLLSHSGVRAGENERCSACEDGGSTSTVAAASTPSALATVQALVSAGRSPGTAPLVAYVSPEMVVRVSLKCFNCTPDQLVPSVRADLETLLSCSAGLIEGYIRPGCTFLTLDARLAADRGRAVEALGARHLAEALLSTEGKGHAGACFRAADCHALDQDMVVQLAKQAAVVCGRRVVVTVSGGTGNAEPGPCLDRPTPLAVVAGSPATLLLTSPWLGGPYGLLLARQGGRNLCVELLAAGRAAAVGPDWAHVRLLGLRVGCAEVESQHGSLLSPPRPLLVLPSAAAVAEVRQLERSTAGVGDVDALLRDLGHVLRYLHRDALATEGGPQPSWTQPRVQAVAATARRLVVFAVARSWPTLVQLLLPATTADGATSTVALAAMDAACPGGASLLHIAVGTGRTEVVRVLSLWARANGATLNVGAPAAAGITPLHVAAVLRDVSAMRKVLEAISPTAAKLWTLAQADDGSTPEVLAERLAAARTGALAPCASAPASHTAAGAGSVAHVAAAGDSSVGSSTSMPWPTVGVEGGAEVVPLKRALAGATPAPSFRRTERERRQATKAKLGGLHFSGLMADVEASGSGGDTSLHPAGASCLPRATVVGGILATAAGLAALLLHSLGYQQ